MVYNINTNLVFSKTWQLLFMYVFSELDMMNNTDVNLEFSYFYCKLVY